MLIEFEAKVVLKALFYGFIKYNVREFVPKCGEYPFFRIIDITQEKGLCSESVTECEKQVCR